MLLKIVGIFFVALAMLGVVLPLLPTTPFLLVAATCFAKSSPRMYKVLLDNKIFGALIFHWQASRSIPKSAKIIALTSIVVACSWSCYWFDNNLLRALVIVLVAWPFIFLWRLPISNGNK
jgi:uncharacterized membrane protein YbaN (DUF454 family)